MGSVHSIESFISFWMLLKPLQSRSPVGAHLGLVEFVGEVDAACAPAPETANGRAITASITAATSVRVNLDLANPFMNKSPFSTEIMVRYDDEQMDILRLLSKEMQRPLLTI